MLDGLDDVPWDRLHHAYGAASDVPGLLRELAGGDGGALHELFGNIWHQGTVYEATAHAVPFLVELLDVEGVDRAGLLNLLQLIATGSSYADAHQSFMLRSERHSEEVAQRIEKELRWVRSAHEAVCRQAPSLLRHVVEGDEAVRAAAVHALATCRAPDLAPRFQERLEREESGLVRASLMFGLGALESAEPKVIEARLEDGDPLVRVAAALVLVDQTEGELPARVVEVLRESVPLASEGLSELPWTEFAADVLPWLVARLGNRWMQIIELLSTWMRSEDPKLRAEAVFATEVVIQEWRPAAAHLVPELARAHEDPERNVRYWAASHLADAGMAAADAADALAAMLDREPLAGNAPSAFALKALCQLEDARGAAFLKDALERGLEEPTSSLWSWLPFDALGVWAPECLEPLVRAIPVAPAGNPKIAVISAIGRYGDAARGAIEAIRKELPRHSRVATRVLGDFGPPAADALEDLRAYLDHQDDWVRINAARAFWRIAGQAPVTLPVLKRAIEEGETGAVHHALGALAEMGPAGAELAAMLPPRFDSDDDWISVLSAIAHWHLVGDADAVVPTLVRHVVCLPRGHEAVRCLTDVGRAAAAAIPRLREAVSSEQPLPGAGDAMAKVAGDEAWRVLCAETLKRIEPS